MIFKANWQDIDTDFMNSDFQKKKKKKIEKDNYNKPSNKSH